MNLYEEVTNNLVEQEELFEMANIDKDAANLPADLWTEAKSKYRDKPDHKPRVKVETKNAGRFPIEISDDPKPLLSTKNLNKEDLRLINGVIPYIKRNTDLFLKLYNGEITEGKFFIELSKRNDYDI